MLLLVLIFATGVFCGRIGERGTEENRNMACRFATHIDRAGFMGTIVQKHGLTPEADV